MVSDDGCPARYGAYRESRCRFVLGTRLDEMALPSYKNAAARCTIYLFQTNFQITLSKHLLFTQELHQRLHFSKHLSSIFGSLTLFSISASALYVDPQIYSRFVNDDDFDLTARQGLDPGSELHYRYALGTTTMTSYTLSLDVARYLYVKPRAEVVEVPGNREEAANLRVPKTPRTKALREATRVATREPQ